MNRDILLRWAGPVILAVLVMGVYQIFIRPTVQDILDDWALLHASRMQILQQQAQRPPQPPVK